MRVAIGMLFGLFVVCFLAIVMEEVFLGGRRRRRAEKTVKERCHENNPGC